MNLLEHLKQLEAGATPGPWRGDVYGRVCDADDEQFIDVWRRVHQQDVHLIAEMRNALPKLLAVVEAAKQAALDCDDAGCELIADNLNWALAALEEDV